MKYVYPAIFYIEKSGGYSVDFPDVEGASTQGDTITEAIEMAEEALAGTLADWEDMKAGKLNPPMNNRIVEPTPISEVVPEDFESVQSSFVTLIKVDTDEYREKIPTDNLKDAVKKTGRNIKETAELLGAPYRTIQSWIDGTRKPPKWIERLVIEKIENFA